MTANSSSPQRVRVDWEPVIVGAVMTALGLGTMVGAAEYQIVGDGGGTAPGTMPFLAGVVLAIAGSLITSSEWRHVRAQRSGKQPPSSAGSKGTKTSLIVISMLVVVVVAGEYVGFPLMVAGFVFVVTRYLEHMAVVKSIAMALGTMAFIWLVFIYFLGVRLPTFI